MTTSQVRRAQALTKAAILTEALPWLAQFRGATVVVKFGGNAMSDDVLKRAFAEDVVFLRAVGLRPVVVHGGGPQITAMLDRLGVASEFRGGHRVTTPAAMEIVRMVLTGQVQREIVSGINVHGPYAVGTSGEDAHLFTAERKDVLVDGLPTNLGLVGEVVRVQPRLIEKLLSEGLIPVVSSVAVGADGTVYNVNADTAAAALAVALRAEKFVVLTDVEGLHSDWPASKELISELNVEALRALLPSLSSGMIPKMAACLRAVEGGVAKAHVLDGRVPHALLLEVFTAEGVGTQVIP